MSAIWSLCERLKVTSFLNIFISVTTRKGREVDGEAEMTAIDVRNFVLMLSIFTEKMWL